MALQSFRSTLTVLELDTLCNDYGIGNEFGPELSRPNDSIRDFPEGKIGWFDGGEVPRDSPIDGFDGDMTLETLLNDNSTQIRNYPGEFLVLIGLIHMWYVPRAHPTFYDDETKEEIRIQYFVKVSNPFDVTCGEEKPGEDETPLLERTVDVVTQPSDQIISLADVAIEQEIDTHVLPPPTPRSKEKNHRRDSSRRVCFKKEEGLEEVKCKYVTKNTGKGPKNEENADSYETLRHYGFIGYPFDYRVTLGFGSIAGGLDHVNHVIRLPLEHEISRVLGKDDHSNPSVGTSPVTASIT
ncbi:hypothetical protein Tco_0803969 [Tanacetum coccineum]|uniref:Uncharacterized protein n=1 Tax=Tanacetum coccineum TaxID=301880 RepID=A0ABQ5A5K5_9ASTR